MISEIKNKIADYHKVKSIMKDEIIRPIDIDVRINNVHFKERLLWDLSDFKNVDEFAYATCNELGLN